MTTNATGQWADIYAARLHHITALPTLDWNALTPEQAAAMDAFIAPFGPPEATDAVTEDRQISGKHGAIPIRIYRPTSLAPSGAGLVWMHGGAFVGGDLDMPEADLVARGLVTRTGAVVVSVDYRLCHGGIHHPAPHDDCWDAYMWVREHAAPLGIDPARIAVGGASAGGNLAASVALRSRDAGKPAWQALLAYPVIHAVLPEPSAELRACLTQVPDVLRFFPEQVQELNENLLGGPVSSADSYAFAALASDLSGYPPTYIENDEFDDLRSSGEEFARMLEAAGVDVECVTAAGVPHGHLNAVGSALTSASLDRFAGRLIPTPIESCPKQDEIRLVQPEGSGCE